MSSYTHPQTELMLKAGLFKDDEVLADLSKRLDDIDRKVAEAQKIMDAMLKSLGV